MGKVNQFAFFGFKIQEDGMPDMSRLLPGNRAARRQMASIKRRHVKRWSPQVESPAPEPQGVEKLFESKSTINDVNRAILEKLNA